MSERQPEQLEINGKPLKWYELLETALTVEGSLGDTYSRFHDYSMGNMILLMMQGVREPVAGFRKWQSLNRFVKKGASGKYILHPVIVKVKDTETGEERHVVRGFKLRKSVFAYSDTEGEELPEPQPREWSKERAIGALGIRQVAFDQINGNIAGYSFERNFAINPVAVHPFKTMLHEVGHIVLGHTAPDQIAEYRTHRGIKEFEAEATAYLVANELDQLDSLNASETRAYIQHWLRGDKPDDQSIKRVFAATTQILKAGRIEPKDTEGGEE